MGQFVPLNHCESDFAARFAWCKPDKIAKPAPRTRKLKKAKPAKRKWLSAYRPPSFASHARMSRDEVAKMDAGYRMFFGSDRGGQKEERAGTYKRDFCIAEFNVVD